MFVTTLCQLWQWQCYHSYSVDVDMLASHLPVSGLHDSDLDCVTAFITNIQGVHSIHHRFIMCVQDPDIGDEFSQVPDTEAGDADGEFDAVKPWVAASVAPTRPVKPHPSPPDEVPVIDWVHGFRSGCMLVCDVM